MTDGHPTRRHVIGAIGVTSLAGLAGCISSVYEDDSSTTDSECPSYEPTAATATDWRGVHGPSTNTGTVAADAVPEGELTVDWTVPVKTHVGHHVPIVADGTAYVHDLDDELSAVDVSTGERRWKISITDPQTAPAVSDGTLVVSTDEDTRSFDATTGEVRWTRPELGGGVFDASPVIANETVYLHRGIETHALDVATGETRWRVPTGLQSDSTPAVTNDTVYVAGHDTYVRALGAADGTERWRTKTNARIRCNVAVADGTVVVGTEAGTVVALDAETGDVRWCSRLDPRQSGDNTRPQRPQTLATDGSRVYVATDTRLVAFAFVDGSRCWRNETYQGSYASGIAVSAGNVYVPTRGTEAAVSVLDAESGDVRQEVVGDSLSNFDMGPSIAAGGLHLSGGGAIVRFS